MPAHHGKFQSCIAIATMMPVNAATEPTERSMWPAMMTITIPIARIRMYEYCWTMLMMFPGWRVLPPVQIWKNTMMMMSAPRIPNCFSDPPPPNRLRRSRMLNPLFFSVTGALMRRQLSVRTKSCFA